MFNLRRPAKFTEINPMISGSKSEYQEDCINRIRSVLKAQAVTLQDYVMIEFTDIATRLLRAKNNCYVKHSTVGRNSISRRSPVPIVM
ncbi:unnamed protein product [Pieris brassicae]|uniref:Uncharacterized protein n=1 Tax=Pieris brassicae TaxID=7116 RepID=A0A9P0X7G0_PIEBR|nr:unnamed protein product [Pieris brassicae]